MKNSLRRIAALLMAVMMLAALGMTAFAEGETVIDKVTFKKLVTKELNAYAPKTTYTFTITAGTAGGKISAGNLDQVAFTNGQDQLVIDSTPTEKTDSVAGDIGQASLTYDCQINIDITKFNAPGIYRFVVKETGACDGVTFDTDDRYLDIYVEENGVDADGKTALKVTAAVLYKVGATTVDQINATKAEGFTNDYDTADLNVTNDVTGNLGDTNKEFSYKVEIEGVAGEKYYIVKGDTAQTITAGADGKATLNEIKLKDGETFTVYGLSENDSYTITQTSEADDGYTTTNNSEEGDGLVGSGAIQAITGEMTEVANDNVTFTNNKEATVPTGIAMTVLPFVAMIALAAVVAVLFFQKKQRREA